MYLNQAINQMPFIFVFKNKNTKAGCFYMKYFLTLGFSVQKLHVKERQCVAKLNLYSFALKFYSLLMYSGSCYYLILDP